MIVFDLACTDSHRFEGWFASSAEFERQQGRGLIVCPYCGDTQVVKAPMAPAVPAKTNARGEDRAVPVAGNASPPAMQQALAALAKAQAEMLKDSKWVGRKFAETSRQMHYGEAEHRPIHGQATLAEAKALVEEGVTVAPLPLPVAPPEELN